ncbi:MULTISPECIES: hypothetical protein [Halomicrobium]|uniref:Uncharacterized protein n=1 Tax=Halomicrobium mukohataei TaxID=57705 RepID=A0A847U5P4_9EURY|nr:MULTISPECIES: hypothetical protein [Halomicrobium]NLV08625.1 hypothetical protein [Halomicrobium mukohataei]
MQATVGELVSNLLTHFTNDPLALLMALAGAAFVGGASLFFGYLTLGAVADFITPDVSNEPPSRAN